MALLASFVILSAMLNLARLIVDRLRPVSTEIVEGYEHPELVEVVFRKTVAYRPAATWSEAAETVLDFGGGCGLHYKQAGSPAVRWAVVETPAMVARAQELETNRLRFFADIREAAAWLGAVDLMHSDGAVQYTADPMKTVRELCDLSAQIMLWKRVCLSEKPTLETQVSRLLLNGPGRGTWGKDKLIRYDMRTITQPDFMAAHHAYHLLSAEGGSFRLALCPRPHD